MCFFPPISQHKKITLLGQSFEIYLLAGCSKNENNSCKVQWQLNCFESTLIECCYWKQIFVFKCWLLLGFFFEIALTYQVVPTDPKLYFFFFFVYTKRTKWSHSLKSDILVQCSPSSGVFNIFSWFPACNFVLETEDEIAKHIYRPKI